MVDARESWLVLPKVKRLAEFVRDSGVFCLSVDVFCLRFSSTWDVACLTIRGKTSKAGCDVGGAVDDDAVEEEMFRRVEGARARARVPVVVLEVALDVYGSS
jgi:hypothetical protein